MTRAVLIGGILMLYAGLAGCESQSEVKPDEQEHIDPIVLRQQAEDAYQSKEWALSEERYAQLAKEMPVEPEPWFRLGNIYARTSRPDLAVSAYREALVRDPRHARAWHNMGVVQLQQAERSFSEIQQFAEETDPLYRRSREMVDAIEDLIHKND